MALRDRLMVGHGTLNPGMKVRLLLPQLYSQAGSYFYVLIKIVKKWYY